MKIGAIFLKIIFEKFPERYRFILTKQEVDDLVKSKFLTSRNDRYFQGQSGGTRKLPYAYMEQGIYMLKKVVSSIIRGIYLKE